MKATKTIRWVGSSLIVLLIIAFALGSNYLSKRTTDNQKEQREVTVVVQNYIKGLIDSLRTANTDKLGPYTTKVQINKDALYIAYNSERIQVREIDRLLDLKIESVEIKRNSAKVKTTEVWNVTQEGVKNQQKIELGEVTYSTSYDLVKQENTWKVDNVEAKTLDK